MSRTRVFTDEERRERQLKRSRAYWDKVKDNDDVKMRKRFNLQLHYMKIKKEKGEL